MGTDSHLLRSPFQRASPKFRSPLKRAGICQERRTADRASNARPIGPSGKTAEAACSTGPETPSFHHTTPRDPWLPRVNCHGSSAELVDH